MQRVGVGIASLIEDSAQQLGQIELHDGRGHDAKQRQAGDEVAGAVDRVDGEGQRSVGQAVEQAGTGGGGFLTDDQRVGEAGALLLIAPERVLKSSP